MLVGSGLMELGSVLQLILELWNEKCTGSVLELWNGFLGLVSNNPNYIDRFKLIFLGHRLSLRFYRDAMNSNGQTTNSRAIWGFAQKTRLPYSNQH